MAHRTTPPSVGWFHSPPLHAVQVDVLVLGVGLQRLVTTHRIGSPRAHPTAVATSSPPPASCGGRLKQLFGSGEPERPPRARAPRVPALAVRKFPRTPPAAVSRFTASSRGGTAPCGDRPPPLSLSMSSDASSSARSMARQQDVASEDRVARPRDYASPSLSRKPPSLFLKLSSFSGACAAVSVAHMQLPLAGCGVHPAPPPTLPSHQLTHLIQPPFSFSTTPSPLPAAGLVSTGLQPAAHNHRGPSDLLTSGLAQVRCSRSSARLVHPWRRSSNASLSVEFPPGLGHTPQKWSR